MVDFRVTPMVVSVLGQFVLAAEEDGSDAELYGTQLKQLTGLKSGTIYPILDRLFDAGMLVDRWEEPEVTGRPRRRYYRLAKGKLTLARDLLAGAGKHTPTRVAMVLDGVPDVSTEDGGAALVLEIASEHAGVGEFVRLQSWYLDNSHPVLGPLQERHLRVTVEVLDDAPVKRVSAWQARYEHLTETHGCRCEAPNSGLLVDNCPQHNEAATLVKQLCELTLDFRGKAESAEAAATEVFAWNAAAERIDAVLGIWTASAQG